MAMAFTRAASLKLGAGDTSRLSRAFAVSLALHLIVTGVYLEGKKLGLWQALSQVAWLKPPGMLTEMLKKKDDQPRPKPPEEPLVFLEVSPAQATIEPPKDAKFYSDKNAMAANPNPEKDTATPKIDGTQTHVARTEDVPRTIPSPLQ